VPLLVYGLQLPTSTAVGVSLTTVGGTALVGFLQRARGGMVEFPTGLLFALAGMFTAPAGARLRSALPEVVLLTAFGVLMLVIAIRMWQKATRNEPSTVCVPADDNAGPTCRRDPQGVLHFTSRCALLLAFVGLATGVLTGLFGVGGGFLIVPALVTFSGMGMQRAIGTSLLVITLVSISGIASHLFAGGEIPWLVAALFLTGSLAGLFGGTALSRHLSGTRLQQVFAAAIVIVGLLVIVRTLWR
jgi:uncharacterized protein